MLLLEWAGEVEGLWWKSEGNWAWGVSPLVFSTTGGMGTSATVGYKRIATLIAIVDKHKQDAALVQMQTEL